MRPRTRGASIVRSIVRAIKLAALVCLAIAAIVAGFVLSRLPGLLDAIDRGKQKQTVARMIQMAEELERIRRGTGHYPSPAVFEELSERGDASLHRMDKWGWPFRYDSGGDHYFLVSLGKDGAADFDRSATSLPIRTVSFASDIVVRNGEFVQLPEGVEPEDVRRIFGLR